MLKKYRHSLDTLELQEWNRVIATRKNHDRINQLFCPVSILKRTVALRRPAPPLQTVPSSAVTVAASAAALAIITRNRVRTAQKKLHRRAVATGKISPLRHLPGILSPSEHIPLFAATDWRVTLYPTADDAIPSQPTSSLNVMSWSCKGKLFVEGNFINSGVKKLLLHVVDMMKTYEVDIMWLNDAHFTAGMLDQYIPTVIQALPDCQVLQFPTHMIQMGSWCKSLNRVGGAIAIVTHRWKSFVTRAIPCPTGSGLINAHDIAVGPYHIRSINNYFIPKSPGKGPATLYTRVTNYIEGKTSPAWAKKLKPQKYLYAYNQRLVSTGRLKNWFTITQGDMNRALSGKEASVIEFATWRRTNHLIAPFEDTLHLEDGYHTWRTNSPTQSNTITDHVLHSPLPSNIRVAEVGTVHSEVNNSTSDHLPIWTKFVLLDKLLFVPKRNPIDEQLMCDLNMRNEKEVKKYNTELSARLKASLPKDVYRRSPEDTPVISPQRSGQCIAAILRHSVLTVEDKKGLNKKKTS